MKVVTIVVIPSILSSILIEFIIPTTQKTVNKLSAHATLKRCIEIPDEIKIKAVNSWATNLTQTGEFLRSSYNPRTKPRETAINTATIELLSGS
jgi:hypothetical protein